MALPQKLVLLLIGTLFLTGSTTAFFAFWTDESDDSPDSLEQVSLDDQDIGVKVKVNGRKGNPVNTEVILRDPSGSLDVRSKMSGNRGEVIFVEGTGPPPCNQIYIIIPEFDREKHLGCFNGGVKKSISFNLSTVTGKPANKKEKDPDLSITDYELHRLEATDDPLVDSSDIGVSLTLENTGSADATAVNVSLEPEGDGVPVTNGGDPIFEEVSIERVPTGSRFEPSASDEDRITVKDGRQMIIFQPRSISGSTSQNMLLQFEVEYMDDSGSHTEQLSIHPETGLEQGEMCSVALQCGQELTDTRNLVPLACSPSTKSSQRRCCPQGERWDGRQCIDKIEFVVVPLHFDAEDAEDYQETVENQLEHFAETSPLQELERPREQLEVNYLEPDKVDPGRAVSPRQPEAGVPLQCHAQNRYAKDVVLNSRFRNSYDKIVAISNNVRGIIGKIGGCSYPGTDVTVIRADKLNPGTLTHELGHDFGLGHTKGGCGSTRGPLTNYLNDPEDDGPGEVMNYCNGKEYFSRDSDEYSILRNIFERNGWLG